MVYSGHPRYLVNMRNLAAFTSWEAVLGFSSDSSPDITPPRTPSPKGNHHKWDKPKLFDTPDTEIIWLGGKAIPAIPLGAAPPPPPASGCLLAPYSFSSSPSSPTIPAPSSPNWSEASLGDSEDSEASDSDESVLSNDLASLNLGEPSSDKADPEAVLSTKATSSLPITPKQRIESTSMDTPPSPAPITPDAALVATLEEVEALASSDAYGSKPSKKEEDEQEWDTVWWDVWDAEKAVPETRIVDWDEDPFYDTLRKRSDTPYLGEDKCLVRPLSDDETTDSSNDEHERIMRSSRKKARSGRSSDRKPKYRCERRSPPSRLIAA